MRTRKTLVSNHVLLGKQAKRGKPRPEVTTLNKNRMKVLMKAQDRQVYLRTNQNE